MQCANCREVARDGLQGALVLRLGGDGGRRLTAIKPLFGGGLDQGCCLSLRSAFDDYAISCIYLLSIELA
jgi:hypothetical protein